MTHIQARKLWNSCMQGKIACVDEDGYIYETTRTYELANLIAYAPSFFDAFSKVNIISFMEEWLTALKEEE